MDSLSTLWFRGSIRFLLGFLAGSFLTYAAMVGYRHSRAMCDPQTVIKRWQGMVNNQNWLYETMNGERVISEKEYQIGDLICLEKK